MWKIHQLSRLADNGVGDAIRPDTERSIMELSEVYIGMSDEDHLKEASTSASAPRQRGDQNFAREESKPHLPW